MHACFAKRVLWSNDDIGARKRVIKLNFSLSGFGGGFETSQNPSWLRGIGQNVMSCNLNY